MVKNCISRRTSEECQNIPGKDAEVWTRWMIVKRVMLIIVLEYDGDESHRSRPRLTTSQQTLLRLRREVVELGEPVSSLTSLNG